MVCSKKPSIFSVFKSSWSLLAYYIVENSGQGLVLEKAKATLHMPNTYMTVVYDGADSIYISGGQNGKAVTNRILQYSVTSDSIKDISYTYYSNYGGVGELDSNGNILLFGGFMGNWTIQRFDPVRLETKQVREMESGPRHIASAKLYPSSNGTFIFGGRSESFPYDAQSTFAYLDFSTYEVNYSAELPSPFSPVTAFSTNDGFAYVFGKSTLNKNSCLRLNLLNTTSEIRSTLMPDLLRHGNLVSVFDGEFGYLVGGYDSSSGWETNGIIQFNPMSFETKFLSVRNFIAEGDTYLGISPSILYVEKLDRIYLFGGCTRTIGNSSSSVYHSDIWFIDLLPIRITPSTTHFTSTINESTVSASDVITTPILLYDTSTPQSELDEPGPETKSYTTVIVVVASVVGGIAVFVVSLLRWFYLRQTRRQGQGAPNNVNPMNDPVGKFCDREMGSVAYVKAIARPYNSAWEIPLEDIMFDTTEEGAFLGSGQYGIIYKGFVKKGQELIAVAIKTARPHSDIVVLDNLYNEVKFLAYVGYHENIVKFYGASKIQIDRGEIRIAMGLCENGSLIHHLEMTKAATTVASLENLPGYFDFKSPTPLLNMDVQLMKRILRWCTQVAEGMIFLGGKEVVHMDLAARNILLDSSFVAKISDFGLSRKLFGKSEYRKTGNEPTPFGNAALECLTRQQYSIPSDVWAYGVLLWEMFTLGDIPYLERDQGGIDSQIQYLVAGGRLECPAVLQEMHTAIYHKMEECWDLQLDKRPSFLELKKFLGDSLDVLDFV